MIRKIGMTLILTVILFGLLGGNALAGSETDVLDAMTNTPAGSSASVNWNGTVTVGQELAVQGNVTIRNARFVRDPSYAGTYFNIQPGASLTLIGCTVDGGAEWSLNQSKVDAVLARDDKTDPSSYSATTTESDAMQYCNLKPGAVRATDRLIKVSGSLTLTDTTIQNYVGGQLNVGNAIGVIGVTGGSVRMDGSTKITKCFAYRRGGDDMGGVLRVDAGTAVIGGNTVISDNAGVGGNGALVGIVDGTLTLKDSMRITNNLAVNSNGLLQASGYSGTVPEIVMNGGRIDNNLSLPGTHNNFGSMIYNRTGIFTMNGGEITGNTGGFWPAFNMRYATQTRLNKGLIANNTALVGDREQDVHLRGGASIGKDMVIDGNVDVYGGSDDIVNNGTIRGNLYIRDAAPDKFINSGLIEGEIDDVRGGRVFNRGIVVLPEVIQIAGKVSVGSTLTAHVTGVTSSAENMTFIWKRNGMEVARGNTYVFQNEDLYALMTCEGLSTNGYHLAAVTFHTPLDGTPVPRTGDEAMPLLWGAWMLASAAAAILLVSRRRSA